MGIKVTVKAIGELAVHTLAVGLTMASGTFRYYLMLALVAVSTQQGPVFFGGIGQILTNIAMAAAAQGRRQVVGILHDQRHMGLVAAQAVLIGHVARMRSVTLIAGCSLAMSQVTFLAIKLSMHAGIGFHFLPRSGVTGQADRLHRSDLRKIHGHRVMGVVAGLAVFQRVMGLFSPIMAHAAFRDGVGTHGGMLQVAVLTGYRRLMLPSLGINIPDGLHVTLDTILVFEWNNMLGVLISGHYRAGEHQ